VRAAFGLVLATAASLVLAQAPAPAKAQKSQKAQKAHAKPSPEQIRRFNELQKKRNTR
jgi:hypothetical protein